MHWTLITDASSGISGAYPKHHLQRDQADSMALEILGNETTGGQLKKPQAGKEGKKAE